MRPSKFQTLLALGAATLVLSACSTNPVEKQDEPEPGTQITEEKPLQATDEELAQQKATDYQCGQVSTLSIFELRLSQGLSNPDSDPNASVGQGQMMNDLWLSLAPKKSEVSGLITKAQDAIKAGDLDKLSAMAQQISAVCSANGNALEMMGLPGEGG